MLMKNKEKTLKKIRHYAILLLGVAILAFGLFNIHSQSQITEGGVLGLILLLENWFNISPAVSNIIIDLTCYFFAFILIGRTFVKNALIATLGFATFYTLFENIGYILPDFSSQPLIATIMGGIFVGVGVGIVVRQGGAAGGDDALAIIISKFTKCKISRAYFFSDFVVLILSLSYIPFVNVLFSLGTVTISSFIIEKIQQ